MSIMDDPSPAQVRGVYSASPVKRAEYFFKRTALTKRLWIIADEDVIVEFKSNQGNWVMPVWPNELFATSFLEEAGVQFVRPEIQSRSTDVFIERFKGILLEEYTTIGVLPNLDQHVLELSLDDFVECLNREVKRVTDYP